MSATTYRCPDCGTGDRFTDAGPDEVTCDECGRFCPRDPEDAAPVAPAGTPEAQALQLVETLARMTLDGELSDPQDPESTFEMENDDAASALHDAVTTARGILASVDAPEFTPEQADAWRSLARQDFGSDCLQVDADAAVTASDDGVWVAAWVHLDDEDAGGDS